MLLNQNETRKMARKLYEIFYMQFDYALASAYRIEHSDVLELLNLGVQNTLPDEDLSAINQELNKWNLELVPYKHFYIVDKLERAFRIRRASYRQFDSLSKIKT